LPEFDTATLLDQEKVYVRIDFEERYLTMEYPMQTMRSMKKEKALLAAFNTATTNNKTLEATLFP
jgi:hypothetical protein